MSAFLGPLVGAAFTSASTLWNTGSLFATAWSLLAYASVEVVRRAAAPLLPRSFQFLMHVAAVLGVQVVGWSGYFASMGTWALLICTLAAGACVGVGWMLALAWISLAVEGAVQDVVSDEEEERLKRFFVFTSVGILLVALVALLIAWPTDGRLFSIVFVVALQFVHAIFSNAGSIVDAAAYLLLMSLSVLFIRDMFVLGVLGACGIVLLAWAGTGFPAIDRVLTPSLVAVSFVTIAGRASGTVPADGLLTGTVMILTCTMSYAIFVRRHSSGTDDIRRPKSVRETILRESHDD